MVVSALSAIIGYWMIQSIYRLKAYKRSRRS